jgi:hypothetical protein
MQVYGLIGQTEEGIWPEAQLRDLYLPRSDKESPKRQNRKFCKLSLIVSVHGLYCLLHSTVHHPPPSTGLSRIQKNLT